MNAGAEVFQILMWKRPLHTVAMVWQALWFEAQKGEFGDVHLAPKLDLPPEVYLKTLGTLVKLDLARVFRSTDGSVDQILILHELDDAVRDRVFRFRTEGTLPGLAGPAERTQPLPGVFFSDSNFFVHSEMLLIAVKHNAQESTMHNTQENTLEKGVGKTFNCNLDELTQRIANRLLVQLTVSRKKKRVRATPEERAASQRIFDRWVQIMKYQDRDFELEGFRLEHCVARLRKKHVESEFEEIMLWVITDDFMMARKEGGRVYNDFDNLFASEVKFNKYLRIARTHRPKVAVRNSEALLATTEPTTFTRL